MSWDKTGRLGTDDGIFTAEEINGLRLPRTELVVLSACDTGLGHLASGEGIIGLQRAFHVAGARSSVATLWPVHDGASRALWTRFYQLLFDGKRRFGKAAALRQAQLDLLNGRIPIPGLPQELRGKKLPPHFWAAWVLAGEWK